MTPQPHQSVSVTWRWVVGVLIVIVGTMLAGTLRRVDIQGDTIGVNGNRISTLEARYEASQRQLDRIEGKLDRLESNLAARR